MLALWYTGMTFISAIAILFIAEVSTSLRAVLSTQHAATRPPQGTRRLLYCRAAGVLLSPIVVVRCARVGRISRFADSVLQALSWVTVLLPDYTCKALYGLIVGMYTLVKLCSYIFLWFKVRFQVCAAFS